MAPSLITMSTHLITDLAETWTLTEDSTFPVVEIAGQTTIVLERLTRSGADQFRHQFVATVNGRSDLLEISTTGTRQEIEICRFRSIQPNAERSR